MSGAIAKTSPATLLVAEKRELADLCASLTPAEWDAPSLCEGWRVRDVVAHIVGNQRDWKDIFKPPFGGGVDKFNARQVQKRKDWPLARLMAELVETIEPPALYKPVAAFILYDTWVHQQDIRWAINKSRQQDPERMRVLLNSALKVGMGKKQVEGMRLVANDFTWAHGTGPEIVGPSEALVMMLANRPSAWERLEGAGVARIKRG